MTVAALLVAMLLADPAAELGRLRYATDPTPQRVAELLDAALAELDGEMRAQRCRDAFRAGELYRSAAAIVPDSDYADQALRSFREMRVDYHDMVAGQLGYIGEARVHRQNGDADEALAVLLPLLDEDESIDERIRRLAQLEEIEVTLMTDPEAAIPKAKALGHDAQWTLARAYAKKGTRYGALKHARDPKTVATAPPFERLQLIAELEALDDDERIEWATLLAGLDRRQEALAVLDEHAPPEAARLYALLLQDADRPIDAVVQWRRVIETSTDPQDRLSYAGALTAAGSGNLTLLDDAIGVYRGVVNSDAPVALRRDALRRWVYLLDPSRARAALEANPSLIDGDPYLRYAMVVARQEDGDPEELAAELEAIEHAAEDDELRAASVLLRAQIADAPRDGLRILDDHRELLGCHSSTAAGAEQLRVALWLKLGMIDASADQMLSDPQRHSSGALLAVADAVADRYLDGIGGEQTRTQVLRLAGAAMARSPSDETVAHDAARILLRIGAYADAERVLVSLPGPETALLRAQALRGLERPDAALHALSDLSTPEAELLRGMCVLDLGRPEEALGPIRAARGSTVPGSDAWWEATLMLGRAQMALGHRDAASSVLRVAETLHPIGGRTALRRQLDALKQELDG